MSNEVIKQINFLIYDEAQVKAVLKDESIWLSQKGMAELFSVNVSAISKHLKNIFSEGELTQSATVSILEIVQIEGGRSIKRNVEFYNLDAIISVGYRINSAKATKFRIWATNVLKEFIKKGFVLDDERLKQGQNIFGKDYFTELLERVRSIRASERRIWQKITDIFAECAFDYDKNSELTKSFFTTIQNKFHYAITGQTAPEIIFSRADANIQNMGLMTWKNSPNGRILKSDTIIAKNYLNEKQIKQLERAVSGYFDYIEDLIEREIAFDMQSFIASVNEFLAFRKYDILEGKGSVSRKTAESKAFSEYNEFNKTQKINSDFDKFVKGIKSQEYMLN